MSSDPSNLTELLRRSRTGDRTAVDAIMPVVYQELRRLAGSYLKNQTPSQTFQPTVLVHEAYLRLAGRELPELQDRAHFFRLAAGIMRQILVDDARSRHAKKRGAGLAPVEFSDSLEYSSEKAANLIALDDALKALEHVDERKARAIELRYFGGLSLEETADALGISPATVGRETRFAEAWLRREMGF